MAQGRTVVGVCVAVGHQQPASSHARDGTAAIAVSVVVIVVVVVVVAAAATVATSVVVVVVIIVVGVAVGHKGPACRRQTSSEHQVSCAPPYSCLS